MQTLCASGGRYVVFIEPATLGGARPTTGTTRARQYSRDGVSWSALPDGMGPITGQMDRSAAALVLADLTTRVSGVVDLWQCADWWDATKPVKFALGLSTVCVARHSTTTHPARMKSRYRAAIAVARLVDPYCAWIR